MASTLYQSIFEKGEARGEARAYVETIIQLLIRWMGALDPAVRDRIRALSDADTLKAWHQEALYVADAEGARRLAEKIQKAPLPQG